MLKIHSYSISPLVFSIIIGLTLTVAWPSFLSKALRPALGYETAAPPGKLVAKSAQTVALKETCLPTPADSLGPFYKPNAPVRSSVGKGYILTGVVRSSKDCSAIVGTRVEFWLAGPDGNYDDDHRATVLSDKSGEYWFESSFPPAYFG